MSAEVDIPSAEQQTRKDRMVWRGLEECGYVTFALTNSSAGAFSVEVSTNLST
jgi:hypothetical protein